MRRGEVGFPGEIDDVVVIVREGVGGALGRVEPGDGGSARGDEEGGEECRDGHGARAQRWRWICMHGEFDDQKKREREREARIQKRSRAE